MEDNTHKVSLSTVLLVLAVIALLIFVCFYYNDKANSNKKISELESNTQALQNTVTALENDVNSLSAEISKTETEQPTTETKQTYTIQGQYIPENAQGDEFSYIFKGPNIVTYSGLGECTGTFTIDGDSISITYTTAKDPVGDSITFADLNVPEKVTLTIIDSNTLTNPSNGQKYVKTN